MKKVLLLTLLFISSVSYAQPIGMGYGIKFVKNINNYGTSGNFSYSALWGYTAPNGREYAILGCLVGTSFIDITDTNNIREVGFLPTPNPGGIGNEWREMKTYSHYAYIVSETPNSGIQIVDLQYLPDSIRYVGKIILPGHSTTHTITQSGPFLYLNATNTSMVSGIAIADLSLNPEAPVLRGLWQGGVHDSRVVNDTIWVAGMDQGIGVVNAVNKDNPVTVTSWLNNPPPRSPHNIALTGDRRYAYTTDETIGGKLKIWNVSDIFNPIFISKFTPLISDIAVIHNVEIVNNYAILAYYSAGVILLDISNPANPVEIGWYDTYPENNGSDYDGCWGVYYFPSSNKIIASDRQRGLFVLRPDFSQNPTSRPSANFTVTHNSIQKFDSLRMIDMSDGIPSSWLWTVTGPETKTSTLKNPKFAFGATGQYTVKLKVTNSFGSDSLTKPNAFTVTPNILTQFGIISPIGNPYYHINTTQNDSGTVNINWSSAGNNAVYKLFFKKLNGLSERYILSGNDGLNNFFTLRKSYIDSMAVQFGLNSDSILIQLRVKAYSNYDSLQSSNNVPFIIHTTTVGIENISDIIPEEYNLYQNYPNPFNPETNIKFDLPKNGYVNLVLYDITGKEVLEMVNQNLKAGKYNYKLNGTNLNSGIYFIRLISDNFSQTRKIVLVK